MNMELQAAATVHTAILDTSKQNLDIVQRPPWI